MKLTRTLAVVATLLGAACTQLGGDRVVVSGAGTDLLKLRSGPSLEYKVIMGLPDGTELNRQSCVTELGQLWCRVSVAASPGVTGYVAADYLVER